MRAALLVVVFLAAIWLLVLWAQPRTAFFPYRGVQRTPDAAGVSFKDLQIRTSDGVTLHGWWLEHPEPRGQIIYFHGNGGNLSLWLDVFVDIHRRGFSILAIDYRGYGASTGSPSEKGVYLDAEATTQYFAEHLRRENLPTIYWGRSLGSAVAAYAASRTAPDALILESPFPDVRTLFAGNPLMLSLSLFATYRFAASDHLDGYRGPLLVIHGDADSVIPFAAGQKVFERAPSPQKTLIVLKDADHNDMYARRDDYWPAIDRFLEASSRPPPSRP